MPSIEKRTKWEHATTKALLVLGIGFVAAYSLQVLYVDKPDWLATVVFLELLITWIAFVIDYFVRLGLTPKGQRGLFFRQNLIDLLSVLIPLFRALRVVDLLRNIPYFAQVSSGAIRVRFVVYAVVYALLFIYFVALGTLAAERDAPGASITNFGDAIWWACVTLTSTGYGDYYPVTTSGRVLAVALMFGGVAIIGAFTAYFVSFLSERVLNRRARITEPPKAE